MNIIRQDAVPEQAKDYPLMWDDIRKEEGVYESETVPGVRIVVVKLDEAVVNLYLGEDTLELCREGWEKRCFRRTGEQLIVGVK